jgi:hypothetical protein
MTLQYTKDIAYYAKQALEKPSDFSYWGSGKMFVTWGFSGIGKTSMSDVMDLSNFEVISSSLISEFPHNFRIETYSHWAVGQATQLTCKVLHRKGEITDNNITDAFRKVMEWHEKLANYPVADEQDYHERLYLETIDNFDQPLDER